MKYSLKHLIQLTPVYFPLRSWYRRRQAPAELDDWERKGRPSPPPHVVKQRALRQYAQDHCLRILVETGTFRGDMVAAMLGSFDKIYSIELEPKLCRMAQARFKRSHHVEIIHGDSATVLDEVMKRIYAPRIILA
jgi:protein-L-isoaspartate O-methyltransferase